MWTCEVMWCSLGGGVGGRGQGGGIFSGGVNAPFVTDLQKPRC